MASIRHLKFVIRHSPSRWLETSLVIDFKGFHTDSETKALAASLILNFLIKKLG